MNQGSLLRGRGRSTEAQQLKVQSKFEVKYILSIGLSYDVASGSEVTPCNKICKPLVVYRFSGNVMTSITTLRK